MWRRTSIRAISMSKREWISKAHYGWQKAPVVGCPPDRVAPVDPNPHSRPNPNPSSYATDADFTPTEHQRKPKPKDMGDGTTPKSNYLPADDVIDPNMYCRALLYASCASRPSRDWIAGLMALMSASSHTVELALQFGDMKEGHVRALKETAEDTLTDREEREEVYRCFLYDACKAAVINCRVGQKEFNRLREVADILGISRSVLKDIEELALEEKEIMIQKNKLLQEDSPVQFKSSYFDIPEEGNSDEQADALKRQQQQQQPESTFVAQ